jgi:excisionase family DNA binding protein
VTDLETMLRRIAREEAERVLTERDLRAPSEQVTAAEFARRRSLSVSTVRAAIADGRLQAVKIGRAVRIPANAEIGKPAKPHAAAARDIRSARILGLAGRR